MDQAGNWSVSASWAGNTNYRSSSSSPANVSIREIDRSGEDTGENWLPYIAGAAIIAVVIAVIVLRTSAHALIGAVVAIAGALLGAVKKLDLKSIVGKRSEATSIIRIRCLECNGLNDETSVFCGHCGNRLKS